MPGPGAGGGAVGGEGGLTGRNAGLGRAGQGSSTCYLLGFCAGAALGSHIFPTAEAQIEQPSGGLKTWGGGGGLGGTLAAEEGAAVSVLSPLTPSMTRKEMSASAFCSR